MFLWRSAIHTAVVLIFSAPILITPSTSLSCGEMKMLKKRMDLYHGVPLWKERNIIHRRENLLQFTERQRTPPPAGDCPESIKKPTFHHRQRRSDFAGSLCPFVEVLSFPRVRFHCVYININGGLRYVFATAALDLAPVEPETCRD
jgi:hypothetical protein